MSAGHAKADDTYCSADVPAEASLMPGAASAARHERGL